MRFLAVVLNAVGLGSAWKMSECPSDVKLGVQRGCFLMVMHVIEAVISPLLNKVGWLLVICQD